MHYIAGTCFKVDHRTNKRLLGIYSNSFKPGIYKLISIRKLNEKMEYRFISDSRESVIVNFSSCSEADKLFANLLNETLPTPRVPDEFESKEA